METKALHTTIQELYPEPLDAQEMAECERNLVGFFSLLVKIDNRNKRGNGEHHPHHDHTDTTT